MTLIPLGGATSPSQTAIVAPTPRAKGAKPEEIYRAWLEIAEQRISAEQVLIGGHAIQHGEQASTSNGALSAVFGFFDTLAEQVFTRSTDVGELSNYMAGDARRWRDLLRSLRQRSAAAKDAPRYHQLTRALAAAEFVASEPIDNSERTEFVLTDIGADIDDARLSAEVSANFMTRLAQPKATPNVAVVLRDANGDVCGEAVFAAPVAEAHGQIDKLFTATLGANREIANVEVSLTRRPVG
ncbi:MAG: hypothetical protein KF779_12425 [Hyphomonadaceae bacterium]|nr:hypothetical protein [Hyphomonadaceae bacterium]MCA8887160.1 hypothetical protein [Hyphomonadaceae bacterium]